MTNTPHEGSAPGREAVVNSRNGEAIGASVFLSASELAALGIDVESADKIRYYIEDGQLKIEPADAATDPTGEASAQSQS